jgi:hypothetical protein
MMLGVRVHEPILAALDAFIADESDKPSRPEAVRRLLAAALKGLGHLSLDDDAGVMRTLRRR